MDWDPQRRLSRMTFILQPLAIGVQIFWQGKGWKWTLWWPLNWQHTLSQTSIMQLHIISLEFLTTFAHTYSWLSVVYTEDVTLVYVIGLPWKRLEHWTWKSGIHKCRDYYIQRNAWDSGWDIGTIPFLCTIQTEQEARECVGDLQKAVLLALILNQCNRNPFGFDCFINQACLVWWDDLHVPYFPSTLLNLCPVSMAQVAR